jgi:hypothetical protein
MTRYVHLEHPAQSPTPVMVKVALTCTRLVKAVINQPYDLAWLDESPNRVSLIPNQNASVSVTFDANA